MPHHPKFDLLNELEEDMRLAVPSATVAFPGEERDEMPLFEGRNVVRMPQESLGRQAIDDLEALRDEGCEYLVVPRIAFGWLEASPDLRAHLDEEYSPAADSDHSVVFSLHRRDGAGGPDRIGEDGLPVPPPHLVRMTLGGHKQALRDMRVLYKNHWNSSLRGFGALRQLLEDNGVELEQLSSVLDFGCGSGRVLRHWHAYPGMRVHGSDYNHYLIDWCRANLTFAEFQVNGLRPPLDMPDDELDLVYAFSVFSHFDLETQLEWMDELVRVVRPGGLIMVTVPGERWIGRLEPSDQDRFLRGEPVVVQPDLNGTNICAALSPERHVRMTLSRGMEVLDFVVDGAPDVRQDAVLLRKPDRH
jgi:SAM-dependent methyltransferase